MESLAWNGPVLQFLQGGGSGTKQIAEFSKDLRVINRVSGGDYLPYRALRNKTQRKRVEEELSRACEEPKQLYRGNDLDLFETEIQACNERESARASLRPPYCPTRTVRGAPCQCDNSSRQRSAYHQ